ncbi:MAG: NfeD family protein [Pseudomonadota bacterium]
MPFNLIVFAFLNGISPWWWIALALVIGVIELTIMSTYLIGPALAAATVGVALMIEPSLSGTAQVGILAVSVLFYGGVAYLLARRYRAQQDGSGTLNRRGAELVGREAVVETAFTGGIGRVTIDGVGWRARLDKPGAPPATAPKPGDPIQVTGLDGATLVVAPSPAAP